MADTEDLKSFGRNTVPVRVRERAPKKEEETMTSLKNKICSEIEKFGWSDQTWLYKDAAKFRERQALSYLRHYGALDLSLTEIKSSEIMWVFVIMAFLQGMKD